MSRTPAPSAPAPSRRSPQDPISGFVGSGGHALCCLECLVSAGGPPQPKALGQPEGGRPEETAQGEPVHLRGKGRAGQGGPRCLARLLFPLQQMPRPAPPSHAAHPEGRMPGPMARPAARPGACLHGYIARTDRSCYSAVLLWSASGAQLGSRPHLNNALRLRVAGCKAKVVQEVGEEGLHSASGGTV